MTERDLFLAALDLSPADRPAFLSARCGPDDALRRRMDALLVAHAAAAEFLEQPANIQTGPHLSQPEPTDAPGLMLAGRYKLLERIGEGGMGTVWTAQQTEPVRRVVAVKLIKSGMDSRAVLARFDAERQALALMDHPNIARVLDGGLSPDGRPFFVMELVKGVPVTDFCDARRLTPRQRLELFVPVCQAIQHAHQKGVIHRDIKPSNVLVALYDDRPVPKVIDFGVAKATGQTLTEQTLHTGFGAVVGTPEYMSPEQASFNNLDIDTRSDVYALGVLLYELLTGTTPLDLKSLTQTMLLEVLRMVREVEPQLPSQRVSTSREKASIAATRQCNPTGLADLLRNELDWIVMKALDKDRTRRYDSATALAKDVERHLKGDAVEACQPTVGYRLRKAYQRNRAGVLAGGAFAAVLVASVGVSGTLAVQAWRAEGEAVSHAREADRLAWASQVTATGLRVDLDLTLLATHTDEEMQPLGLLRLADRLPILADPDPDQLRYPENADTQAQRLALRQFVTVAVLAAGQRFTPLIPPLLHGDAEPTDWRLASTSRRIVSRGSDGTARLWDAGTGRLLASLSRGAERVHYCGFSSDGTTAFTAADDGVVRLWEAEDGRFRVATVSRPGRLTSPPPGEWGNCDPADFNTLMSQPMDLPYMRSPRYPDASEIVRYLSGHSATQMAGGRVLTRGVIMKPVKDKNNLQQQFTGPTDLWDATTGRHIVHINKPADLSPDGLWVTVVDREIVTVYAANTGRQVAVLQHPPTHAVYVHPVTDPDVLVTESFDGFANYKLHVWGSNDWVERTVTELDYGICCRPHSFLPINGWCFGINSPYNGANVVIYAYGGARRIEFGEQCFLSNSDKGVRVLRDNGRVVDASNWKRLHASPGRKYAVELAWFAPDGRFVLSSPTTFQYYTQKHVLIDSVCEKEIPWCRSGYAVTIGWVSLEHDDDFYWGKCHGWKVRRLPPLDRLDLPPEPLRLWAQIAVRGELGPDGKFVKWDEPTWQRKWRELAAVPPPDPNFPFPGHLARDPLHWLRKEFEAADDKDELPLAHELHRRAVEMGDRPAAARWQREIDRRTRETAPPPRPKR